MSIIYEALKKVEKPKDYKNPKRNKPFILILIFLILAGAVLYFWQKKNTVKFPKISTKITKKNVNLKKTILPQKNLPEKKLPPQPQKEKPLKKNLTLSGIIYSKDKPLAIINGKTVAIGDTIEETEVSEIKENEVILNFKGKKIVLTIE